MVQPLTDEWIDLIEQEEWAKEAYPNGFTKTQRKQLKMAPKCSYYRGPTGGKNCQAFVRNVDLPVDVLWPVLRDWAAPFLGEGQATGDSATLGSTRTLATGEKVCSAQACSAHTCCMHPGDCALPCRSTSSA